MCFGVEADDDDRVNDVVDVDVDGDVGDFYYVDSDDDVDGDEKGLDANAGDDADSGPCECCS